MDDDDIARRYTRGEEEGEMEGLPLPGVSKPENMGVPWFSTDAPISQLKPAHQQAEEVDALRQEVHDNEPAKSRSQPEKVALAGYTYTKIRMEELEGEVEDPWEELFQEIIDEATCYEAKEEKAQRQIREQQVEELEKLRKQMDDDQIERRYNDEEEEVVFEGISLSGTPKPEDTGVPLFSDVEVKQQKQKEALRKQQEEELEALRQLAAGTKLMKNRKFHLKMYHSPVY